MVSSERVLLYFLFGSHFGFQLSAPSNKEFYFLWALGFYLCDPLYFLYIYIYIYIYIYYIIYIYIQLCPWQQAISICFLVTNLWSPLLSSELGLRSQLVYCFLVSLFHIDYTVAWQLGCFNSDVLIAYLSLILWFNTYMVYLALVSVPI